MTTKSALTLKVWKFCPERVLPRVENIFRLTWVKVTKSGNLRICLGLHAHQGPKVFLALKKKKQTQKFEIILKKSFGITRRLKEKKKGCFGGSYLFPSFSFKLLIGFPPTVNYNIKKGKTAFIVMAMRGLP